MKYNFVFTSLHSLTPQNISSLLRAVYLNEIGIIHLTEYLPSWLSSMLLAPYIFETLLNHGCQHNTVIQTEVTVPKVHKRNKNISSTNVIRNPPTSGSMVYFINK